VSCAFGFERNEFSRLNYIKFLVQFSLTNNVLVLMNRNLLNQVLKLIFFIELQFSQHVNLQQTVLKDFAFLQVSIGNERVVCFAVEPEKHAVGFSANGSPAWSIVKHRILTEHLPLTYRFHENFFSGGTFKTLKFSAVHHEHITASLPLSDDQTPWKTGDFAHRCYQTSYLAVVEVLEQKKRFESEKDATVHHSFFRDCRYFALFPKMVVSVNFCTNAATMLIPPTASL